MRGRARLVAAASVGLICAPLHAAAPVGTEFQANTYTSTTQPSPSVAMANDGDFVVVWQSFYQDGEPKFSIFGQRFDSGGTPLGGEFSVNDLTAANQFNPRVAMDDDGDFVVAWGGYSPGDLDYGVFARRFASSGAALGSQFLVNTYTSMTQYHPAVAMDGDGDFIIVWSSYQDGLGLFSGLGIFGQRYSSDGDPAGSEFQVHTYRTNAQSRPAVAADADGDFVVAWRSHSQDGQASYKGTFAQRFSSSGAALGGEFQVNTYTPSHQEYPGVAMDDDGDFLVAWESFQDGSSLGIFGQRFASSGSRVGGELQINAWTTQDQRFAAVAADSNGDFVVAWQSRFGQDGSGGGIFARRVSISSGLAGSEFQVNGYTPGYQMAPAVGMDATGDFVVVWQSQYQDGGGPYGIFGQRFAGPPPGPDGDIDGDGQGDALTDGLLVVRFLFGFSGGSLIAGAVDAANCDRCDASSIQSYLTGLGLQLDIDADGQVDPLTDGLLILRYLFGFRGATLIAGAVDLVNCSSCTATAIEANIAALLS